MVPNRNKMSLYQDAKASLKSLGWQSAIVFVGLIVMLLLTGGKPSGFIVGLSFVVGVGFVAWSEAKRLTEFEPPEEQEELELLQEQQTQTVKLSISSYLKGLCIRVACFINANLIRADLIRAKLIAANLIRADLSGADLSGADLIRADLSGADLIRADLSGADLYGAYLSGADLRGANVENAQFGDNKGIDETLKEDLIKRGAKFIDSPCDRSSIETLR